MKKIFLIIQLSIIGLLMQGFGEIQPIGTYVYEPLNDNITLDLLNGKPAVYKTYGDFLNGKPENVQFLKLHYIWSLGVMRKFCVLCKGPDGKKVEIPCDDFWGWRSEDGLFRCLPYRVGQITAIGVKVTFVSPDYVEYGQPADYSLNFKPGIWFSNGLGGKINEQSSGHKNYGSGAFRLDAYSKDKFHKYIAANK